MNKEEKHKFLVEKYEEQLRKFGDNVKNQRIKQGLTQIELAERTQLGIRTIQRIENSQITIKLHTAFTVAEALNVPFTSLFKGVKL